MGEKTVKMKKDDHVIMCNDNEASRRLWAAAGYKAVDVSDEPAGSGPSKDGKDAGPGKKGGGGPGADPVDAMTRAELRAAIKERTGKYPARGADLRRQYRLVTDA